VDGAKDTLKALNDGRGAFLIKSLEAAVSLPVVLAALLAQTAPVLSSRNLRPLDLSTSTRNTRPPETTRRFRNGFARA
jgi:hypothetical protein